MSGGQHIQAEPQSVTAALVAAEPCSHPPDVRSLTRQTCSSLSVATP
jgi:hypothetical protein